MYNLTGLHQKNQIPGIHPAIHSFTKSIYIFDSVEKYKQNGHPPAKQLELYDDVHVYYLQAEEKDQYHVDCEQMNIYLFCCKEGKVSLEPGFMPQPLVLTKSEAIFLAFPKNDWKLTIRAESNHLVYVLSMSVQRLHDLIAASFDAKQMKKEGGGGFNYQNLLRLIPVTPTLVNNFDQLFYNKLRPPFRKIYEQAKFLEIFSLLMEASFGKPMEACPIVLNREVEEKLQAARRMLIKNLTENPDPDQIALELELPRTTLKEGFKYIFGKTIHQFHTDYKMEAALSMLESGDYLVKEIAYDVGYRNPSHFIAAFKKKYGQTPKQYLKGLTNPA